jgi:hypothetical protein
MNAYSARRQLPRQKQLTCRFDWISLLSALLVGGAAFLLALPVSVLDPTNIAWLQQGDLATNYLGWAFYRETAPGLPPGSNPDWGMDLAGSVFYSDSIPILAFLARSMNLVLPQPFQYFGIWLIVCFFLQAWFASRLMRGFGAPPLIAAGFAALVCLFPPLLARMAQHLALCAHWLLLWALWRYFFGRAVSWGWVAIVFLASLIHPYLLVMVLAVWTADVIQKRRHLGVQGVFLSTSLTAASAFLGFWLAGYFLVKGEYLFGYGEYTLNLLGLFDPDRLSLIMPDLPSSWGNYEGYAYLGLGGLLLAAVALVALFQDRNLFRGLAKVVPLILVLLIMSAFAVSNRVSAGGGVVKLFSLPDVVDPIVSGLRSSGRFAWPLLYCALLAACLAVWCVYRRRAVWFLGAVVVLQAIDLSPAFATLKEMYRRDSTSWESTLNSSFWSKVAERRWAIRNIPVVNAPQDWAIFAEFALRNRLQTDSLYLARLDQEALAGAQRRAEAVVRSGQGAQNTVYLADRITARSFMARDSVWGGVAQVDGYWILGPRQELVEMLDSSALLVEFAGSGLFQEQKFNEKYEIAELGRGGQVLGMGWKIIHREGALAQGGVSDFIFVANRNTGALNAKVVGKCLGGLSGGSVFLNEQRLADSSVRISGNELIIDLQSALWRAPPRPNVVSLVWPERLPGASSLSRGRLACAPRVTAVALYDR